MEGYKELERAKLVRWEALSEGWFKCNSDGASRGNPSPASIAFCVRDHRGDLRYASCCRIEEATSLKAETTTMVKGIGYYVENLLLPLALETNSLSLNKVVEEDWEIPWSISMKVRKVQEWRKKETKEFTHTFREGNSL
ncbi:hypothetical protein HAX54_040255, partial [Datura stramonium]|nr:hypothetical protein [Datura stramonium]